MAPPNFHSDDELSLTRKGMGPVPQPATPHPTVTPAPEAARTDPARYRLGSRLGRSGQVYEAQSDRYPGKLVVKLLPFAVGLPGGAVRAFTQEATRVADLRHPHIVGLTTAGIFADGTPFLAMEPLTGETLEERLARHRIFALADVLPLVRGLASALAAAHALGVVHREIRADNVFISDLPGYGIGFGRLLDFGVSRLTAAARDAGRIVAPAAWRALAPEQQQGSLAALGDRGWQELLERADGRTDQFALAALTFRLLAGTDPVAGQEVGTAFERLHDEHTGRCPPAVDVVLCKALSRRPENRYDSMALFFRAFEEACADALATERGATAPARPARAAASDAIPLSRDSHEAETRPAIAGIEAPTRPDAPATAEAPTVVSFPAARREAPSSGRLTTAAGATPIPSAVAPRVAPGRATMSAAPGSLTQQFFAAGDRQEADWLKSMARRSRSNSGLRNSTDEHGTDELPELSASFSDPYGDSFDRSDDLPRRRAPLIAAGVAAALLGFGAVGWAVGLWSPGRWLADHTAPSFRQPAPARFPATPPAPPAPAAAPAEVQPASVAPPAAAPVAAAPDRSRPPARVAAPADAPAAPARADSALAAPSGPAGAAAPAPTETPGRREPLRGMAWSTNRRKLVRSRLAPLQTESGPPPPAGSAPPSAGVPEVQAAPGWPAPSTAPNWPPPSAAPNLPPASAAPSWPPPSAAPPPAAPYPSQLN